MKKENVIAIAAAQFPKLDAPLVFCQF